jgi:2-keto-myo-inositol isomerase
MLTRRNLLLTPLAVAAAKGAASAAGLAPAGAGQVRANASQAGANASQAGANATQAGANAPGKTMTLGLHQNTSIGAGYQRSLEGWAKAGIRHVELTSNLVDDFLKTDSLAAAKRVLTDNGLTPVSAACGAAGIYEPNPKRAEALDTLKRRCEMFATLGLTRIYQPTAATAKFTADDYRAAATNMREVAEVARQHNLVFMVEALRNSTFISTISTLSRVIREANHPNIKPLFDFYHFWSGMSKFEDLEAMRPGEVGHVHFQDVPDMPPELLDSQTRAVPGDGIAPLDRILKTLAAKGYTGTLSVELFLPRFQQGDPFEAATEIKKKAEAVMGRAGVL